MRRFPIPGGIDSETNSVLREFMQRNMQQGVSQDELEKHKESLYEGASKAHDRSNHALFLLRLLKKRRSKLRTKISVA